MGKTRSLFGSVTGGRIKEYKRREKAKKRKRMEQKNFERISENALNSC